MFLVYGNDGFVVKKQVQKLKNKITDQNDCTVSELSFINNDWKTIEMTILTPDFFSPKKLVILNDAYFLTEKGIKITPDFNVEQLQHILENPPDDVTLIFTVAVEKLSQRLKIVKFFESHMKVIPVLPLTDDQLRTQIIKKIELNGHKISDEALDFTLATLPRDLAMVQNEINKLAKINRDLTLTDVKETLTKHFEYDVFQMANALLDGDFTRFITLWHSFITLSGEVYNLLALISVNVIDLRNILFGKAQNLDEKTVAEQFQINPYRVKIMWKTRTRTWQELNIIISKLNTLLYNINSGFLKSKDLMEIELLKIFSKEKENGN